MERRSRSTGASGHPREERTAKFLMYLRPLSNVNKIFEVVSSQKRLFLFFAEKKVKTAVCRTNFGRRTNFEFTFDIRNLLRIFSSSITYFENFLKIKRKAALNSFLLELNPKFNS